MRVLVLTKRQYTSRDLIDDAFGRVRELPLALARHGHDVRGLCLSYVNRNEGDFTDADTSGSAHVSWLSVNAGPLKLPGLLRFQKLAAAVAREYRPNVIWTFSDTFYAIIGERLARDVGTCCVIDLYDNFEAFGAAKIPGILPLFRQSIRRADAVVCVSEPLRQMVTDTYRRSGPTIVIPNAVHSEVFRPRNKLSCRKALGLPPDAQIVGTAGALHPNRDIATLFRAFEILGSRNKRVHLAVAGHRTSRSRIPLGSHIHDLGVLPHDQVPTLLSGLDVAVIANKDSSFGRYCFPQKAFEIIACGVPVVAANVGTLSALFQQFPSCLFAAGDPVDLARALENQLRNPFIPPIHVPSWDELATALNSWLRATCD